MAIRKFTAASAHDAMKEVRDAFGREAIIISNKTTDEGIEILATDNPNDLQPESTEPAGEPQIEEPAPIVQATSDVDARHTEQMHNEQASLQTVADLNREAILQREIADLQGAVQGLTTSGSVSAGAHWAEITLTGRLMGLGFGSTLVQQLMTQAKPVTKVEAAWKQTLKNLMKELRFSPGDFESQGGVYVFHGAPGVGKTTAICKLAASFLKDNTVGKLAIVSAGSNASIERQNGLLSAFGGVLNIPVHYVDDPSELRQALTSLRRKKLVLVDTPAFDVNRLLPFGDSIAQPRGKRKIEHCLVVSACMQGSLLDHTFACLAESTIESVLMTNIDQTRQIGTVIDSLLRSGLPLRYCSDSSDLHMPLQGNVTKVLMSQLEGVNPLHRQPKTDKMPAQIDSGAVANWLESAILG